MGINIPQLQGLVSGLPKDVGRQLGAAFRAQDQANQDMAAMLNSPLTTFTPALANSWVAVAAERAPLVTQFNNGLVVVSGSVMGGSPAGADTATIFVLPVGMRALFDFQTFVTWTSNSGTPTLGRIQLFTNGNVRAREGGASEFELNFTFMPGN